MSEKRTCYNKYISTQISIIIHTHLYISNGTIIINKYIYVCTN